MKWDIYKKLDPVQRAYYIRYFEETRFTFGSTALVLCLLLATIIVFMAAVIGAVNPDKFGGATLAFLIVMDRFIAVLTWAFVGAVILEFGCYIFKTYHKDQWLKEVMGNKHGQKNNNSLE